MDVKVYEIDEDDRTNKSQRYCIHESVGEKRDRLYKNGNGRREQSHKILHLDQTSERGKEKGDTGQKERASFAELADIMGKRAREKRRHEERKKLMNYTSP